MWKFFLIGKNRQLTTKVKHDFISPNPKFWRACTRRAPAHVRQSFHFQNIPGGLNINILFVKIGTKLLLTIKNKHRNRNLKFEFQNYFIFTPEKARF